MTTDSSAHSFYVEDGVQRQLVHSRREAVQLAKRLSAGQRRKVVVERVDGDVSMTFRKGSLEQAQQRTSQPRKR